MRLNLPGEPHLTYCTNIHPGETWEETQSALRRHLPEVKRRVAPDRPLGVGLRLSAAAAETLYTSDDALRSFRDFLDRNNLYVFTLNAFPYGAFHRRTVKEQVYAPDWTTPERLRYTEHAAFVLAALLPSGMKGSISTVPCGYRREELSTGRLTRCAEGMIQTVAFLVHLERERGKCLLLAPEPEPFCLLERTEDFRTFFEEVLLAPAALDTLARRTGTDRDGAEKLLRRHLGICFDVCHAAVLFDAPRESLRRLKQSGIEIAKIQLSAALTLQGPSAGDGLRLLEDGVYLHQVFRSHAGEVTGYPDIPEALAAIARGESGEEWRVHYHVPLYTESFGDLASTRNQTAEVLELCRRGALCAHLEVETYTSGVLPPGFRGECIEEDIARELRWVINCCEGYMPESKIET